MISELRERLALKGVPLPLGVLLVLAASLVGVALACWPMYTASLLTLLLVSSPMLKAQRPALLAVAIFLVAQDPLQVLAGGDTPLGLLIKRADEIMVLALGVAALLFTPSARLALSPVRIRWALFACFGGMIASSIPIRDWFPAAVDLALFSKPFCLFLVGSTLVISRDSIDATLSRILPIMLACVSFGVVFLLAPQLQDAYIGAVRAPDERLGLLSAQGFFIGPGTYSWFAVATFAVAYCGYLYRRRRADLIAAGIAATFVVLSWRRKSILAVVAMVLVSLVVRGARGSRSRALALFLLVVVISATVLAPYVLALWQSTVREYGSSDPYGSARSALYYTSVLIAIDHFPLGTGLASFASHASKLYYSAVYQEYGLSRFYGLSSRESEYITDTYWPMVLGEGGVLALLGYLAFLGIVARAAWKLARDSNDIPGGATVPVLALMLLVGSFLESMASHIYGSSLQAALVMIPVGMTWGLAVRSELGVMHVPPPKDNLHGGGSRPDSEREDGRTMEHRRREDTQEQQVTPD